MIARILAITRGAVAPLARFSAPISGKGSALREHLDGHWLDATILCGEARAVRVDARMERAVVRKTRLRAIETRRSARRLRYRHAVAMATIGPSTDGPVEATSEPTALASAAPPVEFVSSAMERIFDVSMSLASVLGRLEPGTPETQQLAAAVAELDLIMAGVRAWGSGRPFDWPDGPTRQLKVSPPVRPPSRGAPA